MRRIQDADGRVWDVVVGRESWGAYFALFVPGRASREEPIRQAQLRALSADEAERKLEQLDDAELLELLGSARPKES